MKIEDLLSRQASNKKIAIKYGSQSIDYMNWYRSSVKLSEILNNNLSNSSKTIAIFLPNSINYAIAYFSILYTNKVIVPIEIKAKPVEIYSMLEYCEVDMVITDNKHIVSLINALREYKKKVAVLNIDENVVHFINDCYNFIKKTNYINQNDDENDVAIMLHTSGTTNSPKRVMLSHFNILSNIESNISSLNIHKKDIVLISLPMYFGYCNTAQFLTHLYCGGTIVIMEKIFMPKYFFEIIKKEKITMFTSVPTMLLMLLEYRYYSNYDYSSLRYICFGGGKISTSTIYKLINKFPSIGFVQTYGQTECSPRVTALLPEWSLKKIGSVGKPIPNVNVEIINHCGKKCLPNEKGEICVNGPNLMQGYYKNESETKRVIKNGWIHTGDVGYYDEEGFIYLVGRIKNVIISGGINIYPEEIENIIAQYDGISDVCVFGEEDVFLGEIPCAKIVKEKEIDIEDLKLYCQKRMSEYKIPVRYYFVTSIEKTYNGKTRRK